MSGFGSARCLCGGNHYHESDVERIVAARIASAAAEREEQRQTIVTLREGYRDAIGVPESEHQQRRMEAIAAHAETLAAENATLRARLDEVRALANDYGPAIKRQLVCDGREDCPCTFCEFVADLRAVLAPAADAATGGEDE